MIEAIHDMQIARHGGLEGIRDAGVMESALARPQNLATYENPDAAALAAAYAYGLARNHPFADGNKRTAWITARLFLADNGYELSFTAIDAIQMMQQTAAGNLTEEQIGVWFRERIK